MDPEMKPKIYIYCTTKELSDSPTGVELFWLSEHSTPEARLSLMPEKDAAEACIGCKKYDHECSMMNAIN